MGGIEIIDYTKLKLIWEDNFESKKLNEKNWSHRYLGKRMEGYNSSKNISLENGFLKIKITKLNDKIYTAMIGTENKFETKYGYFEVKVKLPKRKGSQSAFWLQSPTYGNFLNDLEKSGAEIDIFEFINDKKQVYHTIHYNGYGKDHKSMQSKTKIKDNTWHKFALYWDENYYKFFVDDKLVWETTEGVSKTKQYIILSIEATKWAKSKNYVTTNFEDY